MAMQDRSWVVSREGHLGMCMVACGKSALSLVLMTMGRGVFSHAYGREKMCACQAVKGQDKLFRN